MKTLTTILILLTLTLIGCGGSDLSAPSLEEYRPLEGQELQGFAIKGRLLSSIMEGLGEPATIRLLFHENGITVIYDINGYTGHANLTDIERGRRWVQAVGTKGQVRFYSHRIEFYVEANEGAGLDGEVWLFSHYF